MDIPAPATLPSNRLPVPPGLLLYVILPLLLLALPLALFRVTTGLDSSLILSLFFWSATVMVGWLSAALGSAVLYRVCARWRPPLWAITLAGPILAALLLHRPIAEILSLAHSFQVSGAGIDRVVPLRLEWQSLDRFLLNLTPGTISWIALNYIFDRILGIPRYRYDAKSAAEAPADRSGERAAKTTPQLLDRIAFAERGRLLAIRAEDHYVRIYTDTGEGMTLLRLSDAITLAHPVAGMQIHRSIWVADDAIKAFRRTGHTGLVLLSNGLELPVSRSYCPSFERHIDVLGTG